MQAVARKAEFAHEAVQQIQEADNSMEAINEIESRTENKHVKRLKKMSEDQLRQLEQLGAQAVGVQPAQTMSQVKGFAIGLVVVGVTLTVGLKITSSTKSQINDSTAEQGASDALDGLQELSSFLPIIGLVVAAVVVIGLLTRGLGGSGNRGRA